MIIQIKRYLCIAITIGQDAKDVRQDVVEEMELHFLLLLIRRFDYVYDRIREKKQCTGVYYFLLEFKICVEKQG